jgi:hypothetical protein
VEGIEATDVSGHIPQVEMDHRDIGLRPTLELAVLQPITLEHLAPTELNAKFDNFPSCKLPGAAIGKGTLGGPTY